MQIGQLLGAAACLGVAVCALFVTAAWIHRSGWFKLILEKWLFAIGLIFIGVNVIFYMLSLLPIHQPIRWLGLPLTLVPIFIGGFILVRSPDGISSLLKGTCQDIRYGWGQLRISVRILLIAGGAIFVCYGVAGIILTPSYSGQGSYHVPQALAIFQDGRIRTLNAPPIWNYTYPKGAANLWAWTMLFSHKDYLFNAVQWVVACQLFLATALLAYRCGAGVACSVMASLIVAAMPVLSYFLLNPIADLNYAAAIIASIAFLMSQEKAARRVVTDFLSSSLFLAQAFIYKVPFVALAFFAIALLYFWLWRIRPKQTMEFFQSVARERWVLIAALVISLMAGYEYAANWIETGSPIFPFNLEIAGVEIFKGPLTDLAPPVSTFGPTGEMSFTRKWYIAFIDWFEPFRKNAIGGMGPVFILAVLFLAGVELCQGVLSADKTRIALAAIILVGFFIPYAYIPRYNIAWFCLLAISASLALSRVHKELPGAQLVLVLILLSQFFFQGYHLYRQADLANLFSRPDLFLRPKNVNLVRLDSERLALAPTRKMVTTLRDNMKSGDVVVYTVDLGPGFLWNENTSNIVRFVPPDPKRDPLFLRFVSLRPYLERDNLRKLFFIDEQTAEDWWQKVKDMHPRWILVYKGTVMEKIIQEKAGLIYKKFYEDPPSEEAEKISKRTVLFRRND